MKGECDGCGLKRPVEVYDLTHTGQNRSMALCKSCEDVAGVPELRMSSHGKLLLAVNSKLDLLLARKKK